MDRLNEVDDEKLSEGRRSLSPPCLQTSSSNAFLSPTERPPLRVQSSSSLIGENYVNSGRTPENYILGSYSDDDHTTPPSIHSGFKTLSPPPLLPPQDPFLTTSVSSIHSYPNQNFKKGRPPRAPLAVAATNKGLSQASHNRGQSAGELSFMSALTDPFNDDTKLRQRGISWDANSCDVSPTDNRELPLRDEDPLASILQPVLYEEPPRSILTSPARTPSNRDNDKLDMASIVNPIESEAETAIMKALELRERSMRQSTAASVMPHLSDEAVSNMQNYDVQEEQRAERSLPSPLRSIGSTSRRRRRSVVSVGKRTSVANNDQEATPLHQRTSKAVTDKDSTMEETLYNLATAMRNIHSSSIGALHESLPRRVLPSDEIGHPVAEHPVEHPKTSSDALANDAALLFRGQVKVETTEPANIPCDVSDPKKNDDAAAENKTGEDDDMERGLRIYENSCVSNCCCYVLSNAKGDWESFNKFLEGRKRTLFTYAQLALGYVILPSAAVAAILYYFGSNPSLSFGYSSTTQSYPSVSWFIIFLGIRQVITCGLAKMTEIVLIDFLALKTHFILRVFGTFWSLTIVQSKGWPSLLFFWGFYDLCMLTGSGRFANHWLFYQNAIELFNASNPSGDVTSNAWNYRIVGAALILGLIAALKRIVTGLYLGGRQYATYGAKLAVLIREMIMISQVANLARRDQRNGGDRPSASVWTPFALDQEAIMNETETASSAESSGSSDLRIDSFKMSERAMLRQVLDEWEEPPEEQEFDEVSIKGILQFKQALAFMDVSYPFSTAFGLANNRENCVRSAKEIYRLLLRGNTESETLNFETLSVIARDPVTQDIDDTKVKELVRIFRPERDGTLDLIGFIRSIDRVYKDMRLLRASIRNSSQIDQAFEAIVAVGFYFIMFCLVFLAWEMDPLYFFLSISSILLACSFALASASAKYVEGLMFILLRKPYDIGDRISINPADEDPVAGGVMTWFVEKVTLYCTTVRLGATNEVATIANSSLACARIVNAARSHKAMVYVNLKLSVGVPQSKIQLLKEAVESFVKSRPREWLKCVSIRCTRVEADLGYFEYSIALQHRESWQNLGNILESRATVISFCMEVKKKLGLTYVAPLTPVHVTMQNPQEAKALLFQGDPASSSNAAAPSVNSGNEQWPGLDETIPKTPRSHKSKSLF